MREVEERIWIGSFLWNIHFYTPFSRRSRILRSRIARVAASDFQAREIETFLRA